MSLTVPGGGGGGGSGGGSGSGTDEPGSPPLGRRPAFGPGNAAIAREGWLHKRGEFIRNWRPRWFRLEADGGLYGYKQRPIERSHSNASNLSSTAAAAASASVDAVAEPPERSPRMPRSPLGSPPPAAVPHLDDVENAFHVGGATVERRDDIRPGAFILVMAGGFERLFYGGTLDDAEGWVMSISEVARSVPAPPPSLIKSLRQYIVENERNEELESPDVGVSDSGPGDAPLPASSGSGKSSRNGSTASNVPPNGAVKPRRVPLSVKNMPKLFRRLSSSVMDASSEPPAPGARFEDYEFLKVIGKGSFGKVFMARRKDTGEVVAMKVLSKQHIQIREEVQHTLSESMVLRTLRHPFLVELRCAFQTKDRLAFVMEYISGGELFFHLSRDRRFAEPRARFYAAEMVLALQYLHGRGIIYRDMKLENLMLDRSGHVKLCDFGLAKPLQAGSTRTFCGTPQYLAPEVLIQGGEYGRAVDWWGLGVVLYEMLSGHLPFRHEEDTALFQMIMKSEVRFPRYFSEASMDLLFHLLRKDPAKRLGSGPRDAYEVREHIFFSDVDWAATFERRVPAPFVPEVKEETDVSNFEQEFTGESIKLTPPDKRSIFKRDKLRLPSADFSAFTYTPSSRSTEDLPTS